MSDDPEDALRVFLVQTIIAVALLLLGGLVFAGLYCLVARFWL